MTEKCTIVINMNPDLEKHWGSEEDIVKNVWPYMLPWFTKRHGVDNGEIYLNGKEVHISWEYKSDYSDEVNLEGLHHDL